MMKNKKIFVKVHLYLAFIFAIPFLVLGITGAILTFESEIKNYFLKEEYGLENKTKDYSKIKPLDEIYTDVLLRYKDYKTTFIIFPRDSNFLYRFFMQKKNPIKNGPRGSNRKRVTINPYTGDEVKGKFFIDKFFGFILTLHRRLFIDDYGRYIIAVSSIGLILVSLIGVYISFPKKLFNLKGIKSLFLMKFASKGVYFNYSLHKVLGMYLFLVLIAMAFTGVNFTFGRNYIYPFLEKITFSKPEPKPLKSKPLDKEQISATQALKIIYDKYGEGSVRYMSLPRKKEDSFKFRLFGGISPQGSKEVYVDSYTGEFLGEFDRTKHSVVSFLKSINYSLHVGEIFGTLGRIIWFIACLSLLMFIYTGFYLWFKKRKKRA